MDRDQEEEDGGDESSEHESEDELALEDGSDEGDGSDQVKVSSSLIEGLFVRENPFD